MSTKSDIYNGESSETRIYEETNEPDYDLWGNFLGFNIYIDFLASIFKSAQIEDRYLRIQKKADDGLPELIKIHTMDLMYLHFDDEGITVGIKGDSKLARKLKKQDWEALREPISIFE